MKYFFILIKILIISNFLFINTSEAKNEREETQNVKVPSGRYYDLLQTENKYHSYVAETAKELKIHKKTIDQLLSTLKEMKEKKLGKNMRRADDVYILPYFLDEIKKDQQGGAFSMEKMENIPSSLSVSSSLEQKQELLITLAQAVVDKDRVISDLTRVISDKDQQIQQLEAQTKESTKKSIEISSAPEKENKVPSNSPSHPEMLKAFKEALALPFSDPTDISFNKSVFPLSESPQSSIQVSSTPKQQPILTVETQNLEFSELRKPTRKLEEEHFIHVALLPRPGFEMEKTSMRLDRLVPEYTISTLSFTQKPEERSFVEPLIHTFVDVFTKTTGIDPAPKEFEQEKMSMEQELVSQVKGKKGIQLVDNQHIVSKKQAALTGSVQEPEESLFSSDENNTHSRGTTLFYGSQDGNENNLDLLDTNNTFNPHSPSLKARFTGTGADDDLNPVLEKQRQELETQYALLLQRRLASTEQAYQKQLTQQLTLIQQLSYQRSQDEKEKLYLREEASYFKNLLNGQENDLELLRNANIPPLQVINEDDAQRCSHCKERSQILKRNEDLEQYNEKLAESVFNLQDELKDKEAKINIFISQLHFKNEELLDFEQDNVQLTQKIQQYEEDVLSLLQNQLQVQNKLQIAQTTNKENEDEIYKLQQTLALAKDQNLSLQRKNEFFENEFGKRAGFVHSRRYSLPFNPKLIEIEVSE